MAKRTKDQDPVKTAGPSWWLAVGEEDCAHCEHTYSYEAEVRCFECDAAICPMCIVRVEERLFCPDCGAAGGAG
jgi:hypothetical protein